MLNRINQLGLSLAVLAFAGLGTAHAQDENPCGDDMDNPCGDMGGEGDMDNPCGDADANPCGDGTEGTEEGAADEGAAMDDGAAAEHPGMVVAKGKIAITAGLNVNLSADAVADPISLAPDVVYGVMDKLDAGLYHTNNGLFGFWTQSGGGLCLVGDACGDVYNGPTGILANYGLSEGKMSMSAGGGLVLSNIAGDTMLMDVKAGVKIRYILNDKMGIQVDPSVIFSLNERDIIARDGLFLPVALMYAVDAKIHAGVQTGIAGLLDGFGDTYTIPLNLAGMMQLDSKLAVGGAFGFPNIAGNGSSADGRELTIFAKYAL